MEDPYSGIERGYRNKATLVLYYGMRILVALAAVNFLIRGDWESATSTWFIVFLMSIPAILKHRYRIYLPFTLDLWLVAFIFLTLFVGGIGDVYKEFPIWDKLLHFQSGLLLSASGYVIVYALNESEATALDLSPVFVSVFAVAFSLAIGAIWEMFEFTGDSIFGSTWQINNTDTMLDLIADGVGALIFSVGAYFWMYRHKRMPFTPRLLKLFEKAKHAMHVED